MVNIIKQISAYNNSSRYGKSVKYIVIHDVGAISTAKDNANCFCSRNMNASAHYFVDDDSIYQVVENNRAAWHVGDGKGVYGITNQNSIGIEMCLPSGDVTNETIDLTVELTKKLMAQYNISSDNVVRHYDASRKICPESLKKNNWAKWYAFKNKISGVVNSSKPNWLARLQIACNEQGFSNQKVDGIAGPNTLNGCPLIRYGARGSITKLLQERLVYFGYNTNGVDGIFGNGTLNAVKQFQNEHNLGVDGIVGLNTWRRLLKN